MLFWRESGLSVFFFLARSDEIESHPAKIDGAENTLKERPYRPETGVNVAWDIWDGLQTVAKTEVIGDH